MKLLSVSLIFNTERARYFYTALLVLRSVTLSKCCAMPKYARIQKSRTSARSSNTRMGFDNVYWGYFLIFTTKSVVFYIFKQKTFILCNNNNNIGWLFFVWYENISHSSWNYCTRPADSWGIFMTCAVYSRITLKAIQNLQKEGGRGREIWKKSCRNWFSHSLWVSKQACLGTLGTHHISDPGYWKQLCNIAMTLADQRSVTLIGPYSRDIFFVLFYQKTNTMTENMTLETCW